MSKVVLELAISLDGYIEGPKGEFDWYFAGQDMAHLHFLKGSIQVL